jgi:hypothetical protein
MDKYDELYERASEIFEKYNPCNFKEGNCEYLEEGCTIKCLGCIVWFCSHVSKVLPKEIVEELEEIMEKAHKLGFYYIREPKEVTIRRLNSK